MGSPLPMVKIQNFIDGQFVEASQYINSFDPSTDEVWAQIPDSSAQDVQAAVKAAKRAFPKWAATPEAERSRIMLRVADLLEQQLDIFAEMESRDQGKPVSLARTVDIPRAVHNLRFFATGLLHLVDDARYMDEMRALSFTQHCPVGVAGLISPWNLPLYLLTFKLAPALTFGNTVVCKPSEFTSVTAWMLCKVLGDAGVPPGVVNMVFGTGMSAGSALVSHPDVPIISFTGSTATAEKIRVSSASMCKKLSLELGGKNAAIVFDDADLDKCVATTVRSSFANQGEVCLCTSRIFVQKGIFDSFLQKFVQGTRALTVGDPRQNDTWMGPLVSREHMAKVKSFIKLAEAEYCTILCGEGVDKLDLPIQNSRGYFVRPTVISDVADTSRLMQDEIFGPVTCLVPFTTEQEVVERANNVAYGLCATVWSKDMDRVLRVSRGLQVGTVWANCWLVRDLHMPFGGTKASGIGREGLKDSRDFYTEAKTVCVQTAA